MGIERISASRSLRISRNERRFASRVMHGPPRNPRLSPCGARLDRRSGEGCAQASPPRISRTSPPRIFKGGVHSRADLPQPERRARALGAEPGRADRHHKYHLRTIASFSILSTSSARYRTPRPSFMNGRIPAISRRFSVMVEHCHLSARVRRV